MPSSNFAENPGPYLPRPNPAVPGGFLFPVPASGTAAPILIQSSTNFGTWSPAGGLSPAANPVPARTASPVTIAVSAQRMGVGRIWPPEHR
jgi:hypothetical protein